MRKKRRRGRPPKYVGDLEGKPVVGLSCDDNGYYNTHYRKEGIKRKHFGAPDDNFRDVLNRFRLWELNRTKKTSTIEITEPRDRHEFLLQQYLQVMSNKDGMAALEAAARGEEYNPTILATLTEDLIWLEAKRLIRQYTTKEVAEKLDLPEFANIHNLKPLPKSLTLAEIGKIYLERKIKPHSKQEKEDSERWWEQFCKIVKVKAVRDINLEHINDYHNALYDIYNKKGYRPTWLKHRFDKIKTILRFALKSPQIEFIDDFNRVLDYCKKFVYPDKAEVNPSPIEASDFRAIFELANPKEQAILLLAANAALYPQDCCDVKKTHIDIKKKTLVMDRGKTGVPRVAMLWTRTVKAISEYQRTEKKNCSEYLFLTFMGKRYKAHSIGSIWRKLRDKAGIDHSVKFEHIRDAAQTAAADGDCSIDEIKFLMGHRVSGITDNYLKRKPNLTKRACGVIEKYFFLDITK